MPDHRTSAQALLVDLERLLDRVDSGLLAADAGALRGACIELRRAAITSAHAFEAALPVAAADPAFRRRIELVALRLASQRTNLARRSVVVTRALASLLGPRADTTYSVPGERMAFGAAEPQ